MRQGPTTLKQEKHPAVVADADGVIRFGRYVVKRASEPDELDQLHRLNYETFVREVAQHADNGAGLLVDKFHDKNIYFVALLDGKVVGMVSVHDQAPFSVAEKLPDPAVLSKLFPRPLEVRLLAIHPEHRGRALVGGLGLAVFRHAQRSGYSHLLISAYAAELRMYERMGFQPLGPPVRNGDASFVPMAVFLERMPDYVGTTAQRLEARNEPLETVSLTPGTAELSPQVTEALRIPTLDHRSPEFARLFASVRRTLSELSGGYDIALFCGSGTLGNEVVAATLAADKRLERGLVLVNGEFGRRLSMQAHRAGLTAATLDWSWGSPWNLDDIDRALAEDGIDWIWAVHLETSTGMLNDVPGLCRVAARHGVRVCLDCISAVGAVPLEFSRWGAVHLATGVSNKSLGGVSGLAIVFVAPGALADMGTSRVPQYLDLAATLSTDGPRFTVSSALMNALWAALEPYRDSVGRRARYDHYAGMGRAVRPVLESLGMPPLIDEASASPHVVTFRPPAHRSAEDVLDACREWGFTLGGQSGYLRERGWLQLSTMGAVGLDDTRRLFEHLTAWLRRDG